MQKKMGDRGRLAQENTKTLRKIASSLKVSGVNVMRKADVIDNILEKEPMMTRISLQNL